MVDKVSESLKRIVHRLFIALLFMGLCQTVYTTLLTFSLEYFRENGRIRLLGSCHG